MTITKANILSLLSAKEETSESAIALTMLRDHPFCVERRHTYRISNLLQTLKNKGKAVYGEKGWLKC